MLVFALVRSAPGDAVDIEFGRSGAASHMSEREAAGAQAERRRQLGLHGSIPEQYVRWLGDVAGGDLGRSFRSGRPVATELAERLPASAALGGAGFVVAMVLGGGAAIVAASRPGGVVDHVVRASTIVSVAVPAFLSGSLGLAVFAPRGYPIAGPATLDRLWLPALVLGVAVAPTFSRVLRASLIVERSRLYAVAARARGVRPSALTFRHTLRPALTPVLSLAGLSLASLLGGAIITEAVFAWPGVGEYAIAAIRAQDHPVVQGYVVVMTVIVVVINRGVDLVQRLLDPRPPATETVG